MTNTGMWTMWALLTMLTSSVFRYTEDGRIETNFDPAGDGDTLGFHLKEENNKFYLTDEGASAMHIASVYDSFDDEIAIAVCKECYVDGEIKLELDVSNEYILIAKLHEYVAMLINLYYEHSKI